ncbi:MAG: imidazolonepropionase [Verrucomicrobiota bacterium]|nr:imidazolonepropionase [Verrucomicrobiota bacterium]MDQ6939785.1 imidazolonepropionase [Verrucomicrobiota bacterium]
MKTLAVLNASQLVTLAGPKRPRIGAEMRALGIISGGGFLVRDGVIVAAGRLDEIERAGAEVVDALGRVVLPGFVDAHAHPVFAGNRVDEFEQRSLGASYEEIAAAGGGIRSTVRKTRAATEEELVEQAKKHARWFLQNGTTTVEAKSGYGLTTDDELKILRVIRTLGFVPTFLGAHAVPEPFDVKEYAELVISEMLPRIAEEKLAKYCDVFCERGYFDIETSRRILRAAQKLGFGLRLHADQLTNSGGAQLAAELGAVTADHLEQTEADGIAAMARARVQPVLLPGSVYSLGKTRYPKAREMIDAGLAVVLATDFNPGSSPTPSMPLVLSLAATQMKMTPAECVTASTINAAYSLNRGAQIGSLEVGKRANFTIFDCADYREISYFVGAPLVHSVFVNGEKAFTVAAS